VWAPAAIALAMSPEKAHAAVGDERTPAFSSASATLCIAVTCGIPTPATMRVVQIEPGPMPTFTPSAP